jgi:hypothetical protein
MTIVDNDTKSQLYLTTSITGSFSILCYICGTWTSQPVIVEIAMLSDLNIIQGWLLDIGAKSK